MVHAIESIVIKEVAYFRSVCHPFEIGCRGFVATSFKKWLRMISVLEGQSLIVLAGGQLKQQRRDQLGFGLTCTVCEDKQSGEAIDTINPLTGEGTFTDSATGPTSGMSGGSTEF